MAKQSSKVLKKSSCGHTINSESNIWIDQELEKSDFRDSRLKKRFRILLENLWCGIGETIPFACQDWASTKAAYRFFSNGKVNEADILSGHFQSTRERFDATQETILVLHDTTEFSYQRDKPENIGIVHKIAGPKDRYGQPKRHTSCGMLMHSSLALTTGGLPLGLCAIKFWTRKKFKGCNALKKKINTTRVNIKEKESIRWLENLSQSTTLLGAAKRCVHIGDRGSDIYELFCTAQNIGTNFLIRTCVDRLAGDGTHTIADEMSCIKWKFKHRIEVKNNKDETSQAVLEVKYGCFNVLPPVDKKKHYPELLLTVIHAQEVGTPKNRERISWKLITNLSISCKSEAIEKLDWYAMRWKVETFFKILKSGCKAEASKLRTAERLANLISVFCILSWRIFWMTMMNRVHPKASAEIAISKIEMAILDHFDMQRCNRGKKSKMLSEYIIKIAKLGGYLARANDPPPGNIVMWRGISRLTDIQLGIALASTSTFVGN